MLLPSQLSAPPVSNPCCRIYDQEICCAGPVVFGARCCEPVHGTMLSNTVHLRKSSLGLASAPCPMQEYSRYILFQFQSKIIRPVLNQGFTLSNRTEFMVMSIRSWYFTFRNSVNLVNMKHPLIPQHWPLFRCAILLHHIQQFPENHKV